MRVRVTKWLQVSFYPHSSISCAALRHGRSLSRRSSLICYKRDTEPSPVPIAGVIVATLLYYAIDVKEDEGGRTEREGLKEWIHEILK